MFARVWVFTRLPVSPGDAIEGEVLTTGWTGHEAAHHAFERETEPFQNTAHRHVAGRRPGLDTLGTGPFEEPAGEEQHGIGPIAFPLILQPVDLDAKLIDPRRHGVCRVTGLDIANQATLHLDGQVQHPVSQAARTPDSLTELPRRP